jgi:hypothetical protein
MRDEMLGALVGWDAQPLGSRMTLRLQVAAKKPPLGKEDVDSVYLVLDKNQAVQLGHYMFMVSGQTPVERKRGWLARLRGR